MCRFNKECHIVGARLNNSGGKPETRSGLLLFYEFESYTKKKKTVDPFLNIIRRRRQSNIWV